MNTVQLLAAIALCALVSLVPVFFVARALKRHTREAHTGRPTSSGPEA